MTYKKLAMICLIFICITLNFADEIDGFTNESVGVCR